MEKEILEKFTSAIMVIFDLDEDDVLNMALGYSLCVDLFKENLNLLYRIINTILNNQKSDLQTLADILITIGLTKRMNVNIDQNAPLKFII